MFLEEEEEEVEKYLCSCTSVVGMATYAVSIWRLN